MLVELLPQQKSMAPLVVLGAEVCLAALNAKRQSVIPSVNDVHTQQQ